MNNFLNFAKAALVGLSLLFIFSCQRDPIVYPTSNYYLTLAFDGKDKDYINASDAPSLWSVTFFSGDDVTYNTFLSSANHPKELPYGGYLVGMTGGLQWGVIYGYTNQTLRYYDTQIRNRARATTETVNYNNNTPIIYAPERLFAFCGEMNVPYITNNDETHVIEAKMKERTQTWTLHVTGVQNLKNVASVTVFLSGQRRGCFLASEDYWEENAILIFSGKVVPRLGVTKAISDDTHEIQAVYSTFGKYPEAERCLMTVQIIGKNDGQYIVQEDVTDIVSNPEANGYVITLDGSSVNIPDKTDGGFDPSTDEWDNDITHIRIE